MLQHLPEAPTERSDFNGLVKLWKAGHDRLWDTIVEHISLAREFYTLRNYIGSIFDGFDSARREYGERRRLSEWKATRGNSVLKALSKLWLNGAMTDSLGGVRNIADAHLCSRLKDVQELCINGVYVDVTLVYYGSRVHIEKLLGVEDSSKVAVENPSTPTARDLDKVEAILDKATAFCDRATEVLGNYRANDVQKLVRQTRRKCEALHALVREGNWSL
jgi:hypothetical protein